MTLLEVARRLVAHAPKKGPGVIRVSKTLLDALRTAVTRENAYEHYQKEEMQKKLDYIRNLPRPTYDH